MDKFFDSAVAIGTAIITVAIIAVVVSRNAQTPQVIGSVGQAFSSALSTAEAPVTGMNPMSNLGASSMFGSNNTGIVL